MGLENTKKKSKKILKRSKCLLCEEDSYMNVYCKEHYEEKRDNCSCNICIGINKSGKNKGLPCCKTTIRDTKLCNLHDSSLVKQKINDKKQEKNEYDTLCCKIKLKPTHSQKNVLKQWFGVGRKYYNNSVNHLKEKFETFKDLRPKIHDEIGNIDYCKIVPRVVRDDCVDDACKASSNNILKYQDKGTISSLRFRTKKDTTQSLNIDYRNCKIKKNNSIAIFPEKIMEGLKFNTSKRNKKTFKKTFNFIGLKDGLTVIDKSCRLTMKHNSVFYLCIPYLVEKQIKKTKRVDIICAIDPGIIDFVTFYSEKSCGSLGIEARQRILKLTKLSSILQNKMKKYKENGNKFKYTKVYQEYRKVITKPTRLVDEMHKKIALYLCRNFSTILIPDFPTKEIIKHIYNKDVKTSYMRLSHYKFRMFLIHKAKQYGTIVCTCNEAYTSQTCSSCGNIKKVKREYVCDCGLDLGRDINAARNIYIKYSTL